ncbi:hypothetical protein NDU88_002063 [Pleurodeles waltl]|uniref:Uncharacterized protein n=1 Tax=Pleurodeles waltl TaxID=8319 RepID=A0AAV7S965_PLEWA|nr:hypothetical protein NDU88_002063 [Pleurodeles waltl]
MNVDVVLCGGAGRGEMNGDLLPMHNDGTASLGLVEWDAFKVFIRGHCLGTQCNLRRSIEHDLNRMEWVLLRPEGEVTGSQAEDSMLPPIRAKHLSLLERLGCLNYAAHSARTHA